MAGPNVIIKPPEKASYLPDVQLKDGMEVPTHQFNIFSKEKPKRLMVKTNYDREVEVTSRSQRIAAAQKGEQPTTSIISIEHYHAQAKKCGFEVVREIPYKEEQLVPTGWQPKPMVTVP